MFIAGKNSTLIPELGDSELSAVSFQDVTQYQSQRARPLLPLQDATPVGKSLYFRDVQFMLQIFFT